MKEKMVNYTISTAGRTRAIRFGNQDDEGTGTMLRKRFPICATMETMEGICLWITGLPGSGKSTLAGEIRKRHPELTVLSMDELRKTVTPEPTYSEAERDIVYRCLVYTAKKLVDHGQAVIIDATGNLRRWRDLARNTIPRYAEVYLACPLDLCRAREEGRVEAYGAPREIYAKAESGWPVPGVSAPYEEPIDPELVIDTKQGTIEEALKGIEDLIGKLQRSVR